MFTLTLQILLITSIKIHFITILLTPMNSLAYICVFVDDKTVYKHAATKFRDISIID